MPIKMEDWRFLNILKFSYGFKGTILDGIADKYLAFPTEKDCLSCCLEAHAVLTTHYETKYKDDKETLSKIQNILKIRNPKEQCEKVSPTGCSWTTVPQAPSEYDPRRQRIMFWSVENCYKELQKIEDELIEKQVQERLKKEIEEQKKLLKVELQKHTDCSKCPTCNK